jgi:hypothetical protein
VEVRVNRRAISGKVNPEPVADEPAEPAEVADEEERPER